MTSPPKDNYFEIFTDGIDLSTKHGLSVGVIPAQEAILGVEAVDVGSVGSVGRLDAVGGLTVAKKRGVDAGAEAGNTVCCLGKILLLLLLLKQP